MDSDTDFVTLSLVVSTSPVVVPQDLKARSVKCCDRTTQGVATGSTFSGFSPLLRAWTVSGRRTEGHGYKYPIRPWCREHHEHQREHPRSEPGQNRYRFMEPNWSTDLLQEYPYPRTCILQHDARCDKRCVRKPPAHDCCLGQATLRWRIPHLRQHLQRYRSSRSRNLDVVFTTRL